MLQSIQDDRKLLLGHAARGSLVSVTEGAAHITDIRDLDVYARIHTDSLPSCILSLSVYHKNLFMARGFEDFIFEAGDHLVYKFIFPLEIPPPVCYNEIVNITLKEATLC
jgi:hypothetical protein